jgi:phosphatidylglycerophosphate synthase
VRAKRRREGTYDRFFERWARWLLARGVHPNHFTFLQLPVFGAEIWAATHGHRWLFVSLIALVIILDGGDGILARVGKMQSRTGAVLDATFDTVGIAIVVWGASQFAPDAETWLWLLFLGNALLFVQNALLEEKIISYLRGPVLIGVAFPATALAGLVIATFILMWELTARLPRTARAALRPDGPAQG